MSAQGIPNDGLRRCFLLANPGAAADKVAKALSDRGVDCFRPEDLLQPGAVWSDELTRHLTSADFVVALMPTSAPANLAFELGLAHGLHKPALVIETRKGVAPTQLRGLTVVRVANLARIEEVVPDIDRFLRHAKQMAPANHSITQTSPTKPLDWARTQLNTIRNETGVRRGFLIELLVADIFKRSGADVQLTDPRAQRSDDGVDLIVWSDDLAHKLDGPILVQCKSYRGGANNVTKHAAETLKQLDEIVRRSDARLAMLVFDHEGPAGLPRITDTPRALVFPVEDFMDAVEQGALTEQVFARREQAAYARGRLGADRVQ
jgi:hypothetical protein